jgi:hypothetical protein
MQSFLSFCLPIIEGFRELRPDWSIGVMEYWNDGLRGEKNKRSMPSDFYTQYSTFPIFHHSMWMPPSFPAHYAHGPTIFSQN